MPRRLVQDSGRGWYGYQNGVDNARSVSVDSMMSAREKNKQERFIHKRRIQKIDRVEKQALNICLSNIKEVQDDLRTIRAYRAVYNRYSFDKVVERNLAAKSRAVIINGAVLRKEDNTASSKVGTLLLGSADKPTPVRNAKADVLKIRPYSTDSNNGADKSDKYPDVRSGEISRNQPIPHTGNTKKATSAPKNSAAFSWSQTRDVRRKSARDENGKIPTAQAERIRSASGVIVKTKDVHHGEIESKVTSSTPVKRSNWHSRQGNQEIMHALANLISRHPGVCGGRLLPKQRSMAPPTDKISGQHLVKNGKKNQSLVGNKKTNITGEQSNIDTDSECDLDTSSISFIKDAGVLRINESKELDSLYDTSRCIAEGPAVTGKTNGAAVPALSQSIGSCQDEQGPYTAGNLDSISTRSIHKTSVAVKPSIPSTTTGKKDSQPLTPKKIEALVVEEELISLVSAMSTQSNFCIDKDVLIAAEPTLLKHIDRMRSSVINGRPRSDVFPAKCRNTFTFRQFIDRNAMQLAETWSTDRTHARTLQRIEQKVKLPDLVKRKKTTSAIFRDFRSYRERHPASRALGPLLDDQEASAARERAEQRAKSPMTRLRERVYRRRLHTAAF